MMRNVGTTERYLRLAVAGAAGAAALRSEGWPRTLLSGVAAAGLMTGLTRYCPLNEAMGRGSRPTTGGRARGGMDTGREITVGRERSRLEQGLRDSELRRQTAMAGALGTPPTVQSGAPRVESGTSQFGREEERYG